MINYKETQRDDRRAFEDLIKELASLFDETPRLTPKLRDWETYKSITAVFENAGVRVDYRVGYVDCTFRVVLDFNDPERRYSTSYCPAYDTSRYIRSMGLVSESRSEFHTAEDCARSIYKQNNRWLVRLGTAYSKWQKQVERACNEW